MFIMAKPNRRGKNSKAEKAATKTSNSAEEQIQRAEVAVEQSRASALALHSQWRLHLVRLSYMVVLITIHQLQAPATYCLYDVKVRNGNENETVERKMENTIFSHLLPLLPASHAMQSYNKSLTPLDDDSMRISGLKAILYVAQDCLCELLGVIMGALLTVFLTQLYNATTSGASLLASFSTNKAYMIATALLPPILHLYFVRSKEANVASCLDHSGVTKLADRMWTRHTEEEGNLASAVRGFPVVAIFHTIATVCCWFMEMQQKQQTKNRKMLENLKSELAVAREEHETKKKS